MEKRNYLDTSTYFFQRIDSRDQQGHHCPRRD